MLKLHQTITTEDHDPEMLNEYCDQLGRLLQLVRQWVQWNNGGLIANPAQLAKVMCFRPFLFIIGIFTLKIGSGRCKMRRNRELQ